MITQIKCITYLGLIIARDKYNTNVAAGCYQLLLQQHNVGSKVLVVLCTIMRILVMGPQSPLLNHMDEAQHTWHA
jgi:hypothetical protein